ncbi:UTP--glucose-1-phosphate uridylyltransferase [Liparis tanakae]|uniref:UTP--glucose-1-phosphate uridylyltransferase n=1 Tax=Liparis tanakae TaxID=230148 RepID=A0A4Z2F838_9TELE|nr:UTP--glucose-1-phosphate uridylyltransferase [Liparis tanakae]
MALYVEGLSKGVANGGMAQFQEMMRQQLESSMHAELEKLLDTAEGAEQEVSRKDFEGFKNLFHRFLQVKGPSIEWIKIQRPPEDSVSPVHRGFGCVYGERQNISL